MSSSIDSNAALTYMNSLATSFQRTIQKGEKISDISINSIASPTTAFGHRPNLFTRAIHWIAHHIFHRKSTFIVGNTRVSVPAYDPTSNLIEIRRMFRTALRAEGQTKISPEGLSDPRIGAIIRFALETDGLEVAKEEVFEQTCHQILNEYLSERIQNISSFQDLRVLLESEIWKQEEDAQKKICMTLVERKIDQLSITKENLLEFAAVYSQLKPLLSKETIDRLTSRVVSHLNINIQDLHDPTKVIDTYKETIPALIKAGMTFTIVDFQPLVTKLSQLWMERTDKASEALEKESTNDLLTLQQKFEAEVSHLQSQLLSQQALIDDLAYHCPEALATKLHASVNAAMAKAHISLYGSVSLIIPQVIKSVSSDSQQELYEIEQFVKRIMTDMRHLSEPPSSDRHIETTISNIIQRFETALSEISLRKKALVEQAKKKQTEALIGPSQFSVQGGIYIHAPQASGPITVTISGMPLPSHFGSEEAKSLFPNLASPIGQALVHKVEQVGTKTIRSVQSAIVPALMTLGAGAIGIVSFPVALGMAGTTLATAAFTPVLQEISSGAINYLPVPESIKGKLRPLASLTTGLATMYLGYRVNSYLSSITASLISPTPQPASEKGENITSTEEGKMTVQATPKKGPQEARTPKAPLNEPKIASKEFAELYLHASADEKKKLLQSIAPPPPSPPQQPISTVSKAAPKEQGIASKEFAALYLHASTDEKKKLLQSIAPSTPPSPPPPSSTVRSGDVMQPFTPSVAEEIAPQPSKGSSWFTALKVNLASLGPFLAMSAALYITRTQRQPVGFLMPKGIGIV